MALVTTLHSHRSQEIDEGEAHPLLASVHREARHARDPDGPTQEESRCPRGLGLGLADADPDERPDRAPARARKARVRPRRPGGSAAAYAGGEARGDQLRLVHQDESLPRDKRGAASELLRAGADASLHEALPQGAEARAGCAGTAPSIPGRPRPGPHGWLAARITELSPKPRRQELVRSRRAARGGLAQPVAFRA